MVLELLEVRSISITSDSSLNLVLGKLSLKVSSGTIEFERELHILWNTMLKQVIFTNVSRLLRFHGTN
jgi:hypothetical protein